MSSRKIRILVELTPNEASALSRHLEKVSHEDVKAKLYPHINADIQAGQIYETFGGIEAVRIELANAQVSTWPWLETGEQENRQAEMML